MVILGYNPSTAKLQYKDSTKKLCDGCCPGNVGEPCEYCPEGKTPLNIIITLSGFSNICSICYATGIGNYPAHRETDFDMAVLVNDTWELVQNAFLPCYWSDHISHTTGDMIIYTYAGAHPGDCPGTPCGGTPATTVLNDMTGITVILQKLPGNIARLGIVAAANPTSNTSFWTASTTGSTRCFEITGDWTPLADNPNNLALGTIVIEE